ncbi:2-succinyl-5-enolpyruvyl-6-hydroxy-3-cyclohexene-1-carboxylate synthase [Corynebacterium occultum]|uniref:2-succinyl-5-enolpyruvyl-6-hydroxy-3-cyclohexene-1-carboxylate synthase n=1 Tax=Corynebacterium occultum TaxID=2675219 RepID=A0A6B8W329_9CORY|nr:2-succinyl-5-enolpyruvyl-6-hydroxy-3-cyclohexene-1-carboxylic-acid synthase [Corynebacterium occultum]QGU06387.1 2-succinyl-5-enolpyruvyl-6-hydroxy-3-cyclohexene-1-carboxylate synthase [Corynebacterium occultum]
MSQPESISLATALAAKLAENLSDVVLCPGSRNSPLSLALLARPDIRVHVRLDERSASFLALGMARVQQRPVGVMMTSGTAVANCLPAMVEAAHSHTPLVVISADRPERLIGTGASQSIQQQGLFGSYAPTTQLNDITDLGRVEQAFRASAQVHLNVAFDDPLVGESLPEAGPAVARVSPNSHFVDHGELELDLSLNTLVIMGDEAWPVEGLEDVPTIAEPTAPAPYNPVHPLAAGVFAHQQISANDYVVDTKPKQLVVVGHPTLHREVLALMADPEIQVTLLSRTSQFTDPSGNATRRGSSLKVKGEPSREWLKICAAAAELGATAMRETLEVEEHGFTGLHVAAAVTDTLGTGDTLVLGSSNPVRDASLLGMPFDGVDTYAARGVAGIDGTVSQAVGVALATQAAHPAEPRAPRTVALLGDITFLHDINGLQIGPDERRPENLTIVVANDDGGGIFESLEVGAPGLRRDFDRVFGTPHGADLAALCAGYGVAHREVGTLRELIDALLDTTESPAGYQVIEARITRGTRRALHRQLKEKIGL